MLGLAMAMGAPTLPPTPPLTLPLSLAPALTLSLSLSLPRAGSNLCFSARSICAKMLRSSLGKKRDTNPNWKP